MCEILRKFDIDSLYICQPYLYTVTTFLGKSKKSFFNSITHRDIRLLHYLRRNKLQLLYCSLSVYLLLYTTFFYLRSPILWSFFISLVSHFQSHQCQPTTCSFQSPTFGGTQHYLQSDVRSFTFYKVVWWHFSGVVGKGVTVCFFLR